MLREKIEAQKALEKSQKETFIKIAEIAREYGLTLAIGNTYRRIANEIVLADKGFRDYVKHNNVGFPHNDESLIFKYRRRMFMTDSVTVILAFVGFDHSSIKLEDIKFLRMAEKVESVLLEWSDVEPEDIEKRKFWKCKYCGAINTELKCSNCGAPRK